jgi:hypothetical protein
MFTHLPPPTKMLAILVRRPAAEQATTCERSKRAPQCCAILTAAVADIFASEIVMGGIHNWLEVMANNHRAVCNINPNTAMQTYNPAEAQFRDVYVVEKIGTKQGWAPTAPDEDFITGFPQEIEAFYRSGATGERPESDSRLGADCISTVYSAYLSAERKGAEVAVRAH